MKDYYELLEVSKNASEETIKKVFRMLIKKNHPDLFEGEEKIKAEEKVKELNEAYEVVINKEKRKEYDAQLEEYNRKSEEAVNILMEENEYLKTVINEKNQLIKEFLQEMGISQDSTLAESEYISQNYNDTENINNTNTVEAYALYNRKEFIKKVVSAIIMIVAGAIVLWSVTGINLFKLILDILIEMFKTIF